MCLDKRHKFEKIIFKIIYIKKRVINLIFYKIPYVTLTDMFGLVFSEKSRRRTKTIMNSNEPTWNQTFMYYGVTSEDLQNLLLEITVWDYDRMGPNEFMGEVSYMYLIPLYHVPSILFWVLCLKRNLCVLNVFNLFSSNRCFWIYTVQT